MATGIMSRPILRENKVKLYKLHPNQTEFFGHVIVMPNLPNGLHEAELWRNKGYKSTPEELIPNAKVERNTGGEIFLVPEGYELESYPGKSLAESDRKMIDVTLWRVVPKQGGASEGVSCPECGKLCASDFGLKSHLKSHKKK